MTNDESPFRGIHSYIRLWEGKKKRGSGRESPTNQLHLHLSRRIRMDGMNPRDDAFHQSKSILSSHHISRKTKTEEGGENPKRRKEPTHTIINPAKTGPQFPNLPRRRRRSQSLQPTVPAAPNPYHAADSSTSGCSGDRVLPPPARLLSSPVAAEEPPLSGHRAEHRFQLSSPQPSTAGWTPPLPLSGRRAASSLPPSSTAPGTLAGSLSSSHGEPAGCAAAAQIPPSPYLLLLLPPHI